LLSVGKNGSVESEMLNPAVEALVAEEDLDVYPLTFRGVHIAPDNRVILAYVCTTLDARFILVTVR